MPKRVAVIGAGVSGLVSVKSCLDDGLEPLCYEKHTSIGGLWDYKSSSSDGFSVYEGLISNTSKHMSSFSDFPMPSNVTTYFDRKTYLDYLKSYARHFNILQHIKLEHSVERIERAGSYEQDGKWTVTVRHKDIITKEDFDFVIVCNGYNGSPVWSHVSGLENFQGKVIHSHQYRNAGLFDKKRVLILGNSSTAGDLAVAASHVADKVYLSVGNGCWVVPRLWPGNRPADMVPTRITMGLIPQWLSNIVFKRLLNGRNDHERLGLSSTHDNVLFSAAMVNDEIGVRIAAGKVVVKPFLSAVDSTKALFEDETSVLVDTIVFCTGYKRDLSFIADPDHQLFEQEADCSQPLLYKRTWPVNHTHNTLAVVGSSRFNLSAAPPTELQARWVSRVFAGMTPLPTNDKMRTFRAEEVARSMKLTGKPEGKADTLRMSQEMAAEVGALPSLVRLLITDPRLGLRLLCGPLLPYQYRLTGPHPHPQARQWVLSAYTDTVCSTMTRRVYRPRDRNPVLPLFAASLICFLGAIVYYFLH